MSLPQSKQQSPIRVRGMLRIELICEIPCNATHVRREKRRSSLKWIVQVQPDLVVICHAHGSHRGLFSRTHEHLLHSYVGPYDTPILVRMSRREVPTACYQEMARNVCLRIYRLSSTVDDCGSHVASALSGSKYMRVPLAHARPFTTCHVNNTVLCILLSRSNDE